MKRLAIYFFFDKDGIVDDYVPYFLQNLNKNCDEVCVVINEPITKKAKDILQKNCSNLIIRKNIGFDSWAYKEAIENYGYEEIAKFDELIICNYTCFGPIFGFEEMFEKMAQKTCDLWGVYKHPKHITKYANKNVVEHIQSNFIAFRKNILKSPLFKKYWSELKPVTNYHEAVAHHELICSKYFEDLGFVSDTYLDKQKYFNLTSGNASILSADIQIMEDRCPLLKRKCFYYGDRGFLYNTSNYNNLDIIKFIRKNSLYPVNYIFDNITREIPIDNLPTKISKNYDYYKYLLLNFLFLGLRKRFKNRLQDQKKIIKANVTKDNFINAFKD